MLIIEDEDVDEQCRLILSPQTARMKFSAKGTGCREGWWMLAEDGDSSEPTDSWALLEFIETLNRMRSGERLVKCGSTNHLITQWYSQARGCWWRVDIDVKKWWWKRGQHYSSMLSSMGYDITTTSLFG